MRLLIALAIGVLACSCAVRADPPAARMPATSEDAGDSPAVRAFRIQAMAVAGPLRICVTQAAGIDAKSRDELLRLIDDYARQVDAEAERVRISPPALNELIRRAESMGSRFEAVTDQWLEERPHMREAIGSMRAELEAVFDSLGDPQQTILSAALRAGLPPSRGEQAVIVLDRARARSLDFGISIRNRQLAVRGLPEHDPKHLEAITIMAESEVEKLRTASAIRQELLALMPKDRPGRLDEELTKLGMRRGRAEGYEYQEENKRYRAVESAQIVTLVKVSICDLSDPVSEGWGGLLEPCANADARPLQPHLPCWPAETAKRTKTLLESVRTELPEHRNRDKLTWAARYLNRDLGAFCPAWIIGTSPLVVAFRQGTADPDPYAWERKRVERHHPRVAIRPSTTPGVMELVGRSGEVSPCDKRARDAELVTDADLDIEADVVLMFPKEMRLSYYPFPAESTTEPNPPLKVLYLPEPRLLREMMSALTDPGSLERQAKEIVEVPVRPPW